MAERQPTSVGERDREGAPVAIVVPVSLLGARVRGRESAAHGREELPVRPVDGHRGGQVLREPLERRLDLCGGALGGGYHLAGERADLVDPCVLGGVRQHERRADQHAEERQRGEEREVDLQVEAAHQPSSSCRLAKT